MKMEETEGSKTSTYKIQSPGNHPKESIQQTRRNQKKVNPVTAMKVQKWE